MAADNRHRLSFGKLGCRYTEQQRFPIERHPYGLHLLIDCHMVRDTTGTGIKMVLQGDVTPLIREDIALRRVEGIRTGHLGPFLSDDLPFAILYLIIIGKGS